MSKLTKRAAPILILAIMALSVLSVLPVHAAVTIDNILDQEAPFPVITSGDYGDDLSAVGSGVTAGVDINLYWDAVKATWDGEKGLLNSTESDADGTFDIWFEVPEAVVGKHYLWVKDTDTGDTAKIEFTVYSRTSCPTTGLHKDSIEVKGYGYDDEVGVAIILLEETLTLATAPATSVTNEEIETGDGVEDDFEDLDLEETPVQPGTVTVTDGVETFTDNSKGKLTGDKGGTGSINYVVGEVDVDFNTAPGDGVSITCSYDFFEDDKDTVYVLSKTVETNDVGSYKKKVTVPKDNEMKQAKYNIFGYDDKGNEDEDDFKIGAGIKIDIDEGPTGTVVTITGEGFDPAAEVNQGDVFMRDGTDTIDCYVIDAPVDVQSDGDLKLEIVIPSVPDWDDYDEIHIEVGADSDEEGFDIVGDAEIEADPQHGQPGDTISIYGYNFTQIKGEEVTVELWDEDLTAKVVDIDDFEVDEDGTFSDEFEVPAVDSDTYYLVAYQEDADGVPYNIDTMVSETDKKFIIGFLFVTLSDYEGPTGSEVTIRGTGLTEDGDWNATIGDVAIFEDEAVDSRGRITGTFYVPTLDIGDYDIKVTDIDAEIEIEVEFEVNNKTVVYLDPEAAPNEYNVTIEGYYFATIEGGDLDIELYNETKELTLDVYQFTGTKRRDVELNENGNFTAWFKVPDEDELSLGQYTINVTDEEDLLAQIEFTIGEELSMISPRKTAFAIGETVGFVIKGSFAEDMSYIDIWDPAGDLYWKTDPFDESIENMWIKVGVYEMVPYYSQTAGGNPMILLEDAPLGTWKWKWYESDDDEIDHGTFEVVAAPVAVLEERLGDLETAIGELSGDITDVSGDVSDLGGDVSDLGDKVTGLDDKIGEVTENVEGIVDEAVSEGMAGVDTKIGTLEEKLGETDSKVGGLSTLVYGAIGASLIAALAAIVSLMQISRRIAG